MLLPPDIIAHDGVRSVVKVELGILVVGPEVGRRLVGLVLVGLELVGLELDGLVLVGLVLVGLELVIGAERVGGN